MKDGYSVFIWPSETKWIKLLKKKNKVCKKMIWIIEYNGNNIIFLKIT